jgi:hypothetical protein
MSMIGNIGRASDAVIAELHACPEKIERFLSARLGHSPEPKQPGFIARLFGAKPKAPPTLPEPTETLGDSDVFDLDKFWHIYHYLFTGSVWDGDFPEGFLVSAGRSIGEIDVGYGPARSFSSVEVCGIQKFLDSLNHAEIRTRLASVPAASDDLYYSVAWENDSGIDEELKALVEELQNLKKFVTETTLQKKGLVVWLD